jgi:hypothetical protein
LWLKISYIITMPFAVPKIILLLEGLMARQEREKLLSLKFY